MDSVADTAKSGGLPHSEIHGSKGAHPSPRLFAACHVLHRLCMPRHPPNALKSLENHHEPENNNQTRSSSPTPRRHTQHPRPITIHDKQRQNPRATHRDQRKNPFTLSKIRDQASGISHQTNTPPHDPNNVSLSRMSSSATKEWWSQTGSNRRPPACKAGALPTELWPLSVTSWQ